MTLSKTAKHLGTHYETIVIGSGYGGGIAAARLAQMGVKVCVLERGREIPTGEFPDTMTGGIKDFQAESDKGHIGKQDALFDLRVNEDISVFVGCGLGGTSLINGNIMLVPERRVFEDPAWPKDIREDCDAGLADGYAKAESMLRPARYPGTPSLPKIDAFKASAKALGAEMTYPLQTVTFEDTAGVNAAGVMQPPCTRCGDCCSGCNVGAKTTTALTYLPAAKTAGAEIFTGVKVHHIERAGDTWAIIYEQIGEDAQNDTERTTRDDGFYTVTANTVFCGAGTLGSTEIMLRSKEAGLSLSSQLGTNFSGNGDVLAFAYNNDRPINGIGFGHPKDADVDPVGPVIAGLIDLRSDGPLNENMVIQEGALPSLLAPLLPMAFAGASPLFGEDMMKGDFWKELGRSAKSLALGAYKGAMHNTQTYLVMAHDSSGGEMVLEDDRVRLVWPDVGDRPVFKRIDAVLKTATAATGGTYVPNPIWSKALGRNVISVHPLGGCALGDDAESGVVNHKGQVFDGQGGIHDGLFILDGSVIPRSLGVNPSLTISAVTERAMALYGLDQELIMER